ncbi:glycogen/starch/alpha-glucan phosphorylase [Streptomyces spectabilis]|uniref:Glycogen/starch/alpha-glucan phosphorylase n=1 Tax=Streptomyces spectabilis TaxID=68270 RepID=A0A516R440_STRST|nr:glycogen/starch/alpha-glucan phosphorylase [Streptomyces spectabilis]QDQ10427.1 glycogen/starch/alpha-glucan phosphorylase [Streptomyces spectabilis]
MTETGGTYVHESHGSVHGGEGPQYNFYVAAAAATSRLRDQAGHRPRTISRTDRIHLYQRFVDPPQFTRVREVLREARVVLLDGPPGSGRRAAAVMLLHELPDSRGSLHELPDTLDDSAASIFDAREASAGDRLLLDLSEAEEARYVDIQRDLFAFRDRLSALDAHLVVVLPHHLGYLLRDDLRHLSAEIGRPSGMRVLARHLRCENIEPTATELEGKELRGYLARAPLRTVAALADGIRRHRDTDGADREFPQWLAAALADEHDQAGRVAADIAAEDSGRRRALLLSLAMFHGSPPSTILSATNTLLKALSHPHDETPRLDRTDLYAEFTAVRAEVDTDGRVSFALPGYDSAVRDHFWTYMPDVRRQLRDWFRDCMSSPGLDPGERQAAVARFAEQGLRCQRPEDLRALVERWTRTDASPRCLPDAAQLLAFGLSDDQHGRYFRQQIYDWSTAADTNEHLRHALVLVCSESMAPTHPDQALVRLHHLARRGKARDGVAAQKAVLSLARSENRLYELMLTRLSTDRDQRWWADRDSALFLALADPIRRIRSPRVQALLTQGWSATLRRADESWAGYVPHWLSACIEYAEHRGHILEVLAAACAADSRTAGRLYRAARAWQHAADGAIADRADTVDHLLRAIDIQQGIESYPCAV